MKDYILFNITKNGIEGLSVEELMAIVSKKRVGKYKLKVMKVSGKITLPQNSYYHGLIGIIANVYEQSFEYYRQYFKWKLFPMIKDIDGCMIPKSTAELTKEESSKVIDELHKFCFDFLDICLPTPVQWELLVL